MRGLIGTACLTVLLTVSSIAEAGDFFGGFIFRLEGTACADVDGVEWCLLEDIRPISSSCELVTGLRITNRNPEKKRIDIRELTLAVDGGDRRGELRSGAEVRFLLKKSLRFGDAIVRQHTAKLLPQRMTLGPGESRQGQVRFVVLDKGEQRRKRPVLRGQHIVPLLASHLPMWVALVLDGVTVSRLPLALDDVGGAEVVLTVRHQDTTPEHAWVVHRIWSSPNGRIYENDDGSVLLVTREKVVCWGRRAASFFDFSSDDGYRCRLGDAAPLGRLLFEVGGADDGPVLHLRGWDVPLEILAGEAPGWVRSSHATTRPSYRCLLK